MSTRKSPKRALTRSDWLKGQPGDSHIGARLLILPRNNDSGAQDMVVVCRYTRHLPDVNTWANYERWAYLPQAVSTHRDETLSVEMYGLTDLACYLADPGTSLHVGAIRISLILKSVGQVQVPRNRDSEYAEPLPCVSSRAPQDLVSVLECSPHGAWFEASDGDSHDRALAIDALNAAIKRATPISEVA